MSIDLRNEDDLQENEELKALEEKANFNHKMKVSRMRITARDAQLIAFLAMFPAADVEALSMLSKAGSTPFDNRPTDVLTSIASTEKRLKKLIKLGAINAFRNPLVVGLKHYGVTDLGREAAVFYGFEIDGMRGIENLSISRLNHYRAVALTAASLVSPLPNAIQQAVGGPFELGELVCENAMRVSFDRARRAQKKAREDGLEDAGTWAQWRRHLLKQSLGEVGRGLLSLSDLVAETPAVLTVGDEQRAVIQPDLAVLLDGRNGRDASGNRNATNILVEVEMSRKQGGFEEYRERLEVLAREIATHTVYGKVLYVVGSAGIGNAVKRADEAVGLIASGRLAVVELSGRQGKKNPVKPARIPTVFPMAKSGRVEPQQF